MVKHNSKSQRRRNLVTEGVVLLSFEILIRVFCCIKTIDQYFD
jgi:hypothetical protein